VQSRLFRSCNFLKTFTSALSTLSLLKHNCSWQMLHWFKSQHITMNICINRFSEMLHEFIHESRIELSSSSSSHSTFYGATQPVLSGASQGALMKGQTKQVCLKLVTEDTVWVSGPDSQRKSSMPGVRLQKTKSWLCMIACISNRYHFYLMESTEYLAL